MYRSQVTKHALETGNYDFGSRTRELDVAHLHELMKFMRESPWVDTSTQLIAMGLLQHGIGAFLGDEQVERLPRIMERWVRDRIVRFVHDVVRHLACIGFVVFEVNEDLMDASVVDPRTVIIEMIKRIGEPMRYEIRSRDVMPGKADVVYHIKVKHDPDMMTGRTNGLLAKLMMQQHTILIMTRNRTMVDTVNANTTFLLESADKKVADPYLHGPNESTAIFGGGGATIAGISRGNDVLHEAREDLVERMLMHDLRVVRNMSAGKPQLMKHIQSEMCIEDVDPSGFGFIPVPAGKTARQRIYPPANHDYVDCVLHMERVIANTFGVPYSIVEKHTGNHSNAIDLENALLQTTCRLYLDHVQVILENVSILLFDKKESIGTLLETLRGESIAIGANSRRDRTIAAEVAEKYESAGEPIRLQVVTMFSPRETALLYENGQLTMDAYQRYQCMSRGCSKDVFEKRDVRPIMQPPPESAGGGGPGHHGKSTLSQVRGETQRQTQDPTTSLRRKRAKPGNS